MKLLLVVLIFIVGCDSKEEKWNYKITQRWEYRIPNYTWMYKEDTTGWKLSTYVYRGENIINSWGLMTEQPDTIKHKYIQLAKEYIEHQKQRYDTVILLK